MARIRFLDLATALALAAAVACGSAEETSAQGGAAAADASGGSGGASAAGGRDGAGGEGGEDASSGGSSAGNAGSAGFGAAGSTGLTCDPDASAPDGCTEQTIEGTPAPLDIIWLVDQSCSMDDEIAQVRSNINQSFANVIEQSGIDYRVIMIADADDPKRVCVDPPLGGATCGQNNDPVFYHVDQRNLSYNSLGNFRDTFPIFVQYLRPGALRVIIEVSDDESDVTDTDFDAWLLTGGGAGYFGTLEHRRYVFHSIIGIRQTAQPTEPVVFQKCNTAVGPGVQYQRLSITSGGLRTPICAGDYSPVFRAIADLVVSAGSCELALPAEVYAADVGVQYTPGGAGVPIDLPRVTTEVACGKADGFYLDSVCRPTRAILCPGSCSTVRADASPKLTLRLGCQ